MSPSAPLDGPDQLSTEQYVAAYASIATKCVFAGLGASDAEDLAQDVWEWALRSGNGATIAISPWLTAVTANFIRRHWKRRLREKAILQEFGDGLPGREEDSHREAEAKLFLDRLASRSTDSDRGLLVLMRQGLRLSEASDRLGIPKGSQQFHLRNLKKVAKRMSHPSRTGSLSTE